MTDRWTDAEITARLQSLWTSELRRAQAEYRAFPGRGSTRIQLMLPAGIVAVVVAVLALAVVLQQIGGVPAPGSNGIRLGSDGLPVAIGGQSVLRGDQIAQRLVEGPATAFLAGGRLVVDGAGCSNAPGAASCVETWRLASVDDTGPIFRLEGVAEATGFVRTSGALTVVRVAACGSGCGSALSAAEVVWRAPTKGRVPTNGSGTDGAIYQALWPDFIATYGQDGMTIAGYVPKSYLLHGAETVPGTPENPPQDAPYPVYGEDLTTLVGYLVPGEGFVPMAEYKATAGPSAPPAMATSSPAPTR